jgi:hypothetical protein
MARAQRGCLVLLAICIALLLSACSLTFLGLATQILTPPPVLIDWGPLWIGDTCRDIQQHVAPIACPPAYTVTMLVIGPDPIGRRSFSFTLPRTRRY